MLVNFLAIFNETAITHFRLVSARIQIHAVRVKRIIRHCGMVGTLIEAEHLDFVRVKLFEINYRLFQLLIHVCRFPIAVSIGTPRDLFPVEEAMARTGEGTDHDCASLALFL